MRRYVGVAGDDPNGFVVDAELVSDDLRDNRLGSLPVLADANEAMHLAGGR